MAPVDKRSARTTVALTPELLVALQQIALAEEVTVSDLLYNLALHFARDQYRRYTHLRQAFADFPELPDKPDLPDKSA